MGHGPWRKKRRSLGSNGTGRAQNRRTPDAGGSPRGLHSYSRSVARLDSQSVTQCMTLSPRLEGLLPLYEPFSGPPQELLRERARELRYSSELCGLSSGKIRSSLSLSSRSRNWSLLKPTPSASEQPGAAASTKCPLGFDRAWRSLV